jgi:hypothetical protein
MVFFFTYNMKDKVKRPFQMFLKNIAGKQEGREYRHTVISYYLGTTIFLDNQLIRCHYTLNNVRSPTAKIWTNGHLW